MLTKNRSKHKRCASSDAFKIGLTKSNKFLNSNLQKTLETANLLKNDTKNYWVCSVIFSMISILIYSWLVYYTDIRSSSSSKSTSEIYFLGLPIFQIYLLLHAFCFCFTLLSYQITKIKLSELEKVLNDEINQSQVDFHLHYKNLSFTGKIFVKIKRILEFCCYGITNDEKIDTPNPDLSYSHSYKEQHSQETELKISKINQITEHFKDFHACTSLLSIFQIFYPYSSYFIFVAAFYVIVRIYPVYGWKLKYKITKTLQVRGDNLKQGIKKLALSRNGSENEIERKKS